MNSADFRQCVFNIGSWASLEPLERLSDRANVFIYVDYAHQPAELEIRLREEFARRQGLALDSLQIRRDLGFHDIPFVGEPHLALPKLLSLIGRFEGTYRKVFVKPMEWALAEGSAPQQWMINVAARRIIGMPGGSSVERPIRLIVLGGEGLLTYCALSGFGQVAPRALVSIQTGMEGRDGMIHVVMSHIADGGGALPGCWVRGFEPRKDEQYDRSVAELVLTPTSPFPWVGQRYQRWRSERSFLDDSLDRKVVAFIPSMPMSPSDADFGRHRIIARQISASDIEEVDVALVPPRVAHELSLSHPQHRDRLISTAEILPPGIDMPSAIEMLDRFAARLRNTGARSVAMLPPVREDELVVVEAWLRLQAERRYVVSLPAPMDWAGMPWRW